MNKDRGSLVYLSLACLVAALGGLLFGFDTAVISGAEGPVAKQFQLSAVMEGWIVSSALVGCLIGATIAGFLSDRFGRKKVMLLAAVLFVLCSIGSAMPRMPWHLVVARIIGGTGIGIASMLSPMYIAEIAPARLRGALVSTYQLAITIGIVMAFFSNYALASLAHSNATMYGGGVWRWIFVDEVWRGMLLAGVVPAAILLGLLFFIPESPRWLTKQGRADAALAILTRVSGREQATAEMRDIEATLPLETGSIRQLFQPGIQTALWIGILLPFFSQLCGINVIIYYGPKVLEAGHLSKDAALLFQVLLGCVNTVFTLAAIFTVDRLGRKPLLLVGVVGVGLMLFLAGLMFAVSAPPVAMLVVFACYLACFSFSYGPVCWIIMAEIFPTAIRGRAMSISIFSLWTACNLVALTFPAALASYGPTWTFWLFGLTTPLAILYVLMRVPETKGKSLEQIERQFMH
ncbi:MAG: sugar porter family MFS transporter [Thermoguttaceae bacterium]